MNDADCAAHVRYKLIGPDRGPLYVILGGISATCDVVSRDDGSPGWWHWLVGPGRTIDTRNSRVLSFDFLTEASDGASVVSTLDQARALKNLLDRLRIGAIDAFLGASYGGMVALAFASLFPDRLNELIVVAASHKSSPYSIAFRTLQRKLMQTIGSETPREALSLARSLAMLTYRTEEEINHRFDGAILDEEDPDSFPVWRYLKHQGDKYAEVTCPYRYLSLSRSIDHHRIEPDSIKTPLTLLAFKKDFLVPLSYCEELAAEAAGPSQIVRLSSIYGHDAFLKEEEKMIQEINRINRRFDRRPNRSI